ncbi:NAD-dependent epimerase/dehydratase family protein [Nafulsella turpanensis]|uniref:NAD-dependent epimerase/dehydratase family protein n=1 Tax=Nafulsella turpanensis TaxID=1265690 RepID=UPI00034DB89A|nr:SDR family oxidoreductase [Nafulsella turpanensis]
MKILVTGGAGYIGTSLIQALVKDEQVSEVIIYDNLSRTNFNLFLGRPYPEGQKIRFVQGDLLDSRKLKKNLEGVSVVYHLAAKVSTPFANTDGHMHEQVNHWGTAELVYAVEDSEVEKLIYTSSSSVYGSSKALINEQDQPNPKTLYGISKLRGEEHVLRLKDRLKTYVIRLGNVFGYNKSMRFDAVINRFMFDAHFKNRISIDGNGKQWRAFVHVETVKEVLSQLAYQQIPSGIYNLVDRNLQILDVVDVLKEIYPQLEFIFINQHLQLSEIQVEPSVILQQYFPHLAKDNLKEELLAFKEEFAF